MSESDLVYGAFLGPDQDLARSLSTLEFIASNLLRQRHETGCGDPKKRHAPSSLTCSGYPNHSSPMQKTIQSP